LDELIDNAIKFSPTGGAVELAARRTKDGVEFSVTDEGIGISPERADAITVAFNRAHPEDGERFGGLGLGLAYASGVLGAHGSRLSLRPAAAGTTFIFVLPTTSMVTRMPAQQAMRDR
jgi:two-component system, OmpR family, sensor histidine kinase ChvG